MNCCNKPIYADTFGFAPKFVFFSRRIVLICDIWMIKFSAQDDFSSKFNLVFVTDPR